MEAELQAATLAAVPPGTDLPTALVAGTDAFLDAVMAPDVQRISLLDGPAVLGPEAYENPHVQASQDALRAGLAAGIAMGIFAAADADALARLVSGASLQAAVLIARSDDPTAARAAVGGALRVLLEGLVRR